MENRRHTAVRRGGALLAVLWLAAALAAIAFSLAGTVRGEAERTSTAVDGVRAYYLATGAIERALLYMTWGGQAMSPDAAPRYWAPWMPSLRFSFPTGEAVVEIIPESSKLNINAATPDDLLRLLWALGAEPERAREIVMGILDWRAPPPQPGPTLFDQFYLAQTPSFRSRHASFEEVEELLLIKGMTLELFHGGYARDPEGRLTPRVGLNDCVSVYGGVNRFDVNTAPPALLTAIGLSPATVASIVQTRSAQPFRMPGQLTPLGPEAARLGIGGASIYTLRAVARLRQPDGRLSDLRRSVAATVKLTRTEFQPYTVLRWQDNAWAQ